MMHISYELYIFFSKQGLLIQKQLLISLEWPKLPLTSDFNTAKLN